MAEHTGSTPMFAIFLLSMYSLFIIPYTLYKLSGSSSDEPEAAKTWSSKKGKKERRDWLARWQGVFSTRLILAWLAWAALLWYVQHNLGSIENFDPFQILQVPMEATESEIKKAYRRLSLLYHPDKNPDPKATEYFASHIAKAYKALTDQVSRENYQKYGHPDGPQAMSMSVALPEWFFSKDKQAAPLILLVLLFGGIVTPLGLAAWYLMGTQKFVGPNQLFEDTIQRFLHPQLGIRESQALGRIPDTLVLAQEFMTMPTPPEQGPAMDELRKTVLRLHPELKDKGPFWKRITPILKAHMLMLAHTGRASIPPVLKKDLDYVLTKSPALLQEMLGLAAAPRIQPNYGWLVPTVGCIEMLQCLVQAVPLAAKKDSRVGKSAESVAALLQLPHFDGEVLRKLARKKVKTLPELQRMDAEARHALLESCGLSGGEAEDVETMLSAMPTVWVSAQCVVEAGEVDDDVVLEQDVVTCRIQVVLTRPSHLAPAFRPSQIKGKAVLAYAPLFPVPKDENWYFILADPASNASMIFTKQNLMQAEVLGAQYAAQWAAQQEPGTASLLDGGGGGAAGNSQAAIVGSKKAGSPAANPMLPGSNFDPLAGAGSSEGAEEPGLEERTQTIELKFLAPFAAGRYDLQLLCMPDSWVGCDRAVPIKLKVEPLTRADREGRGRRAALQHTEESDLFLGAAADGSDDGSDAGDEGKDQEYDSDEFGTEESGDEDEDGTESDED